MTHSTNRQQTPLLVIVMMLATASIIHGQSLWIDRNALGMAAESAGAYPAVVLGRCAISHLDYAGATNRRRSGSDRWDGNPSMATGGSENAVQRKTTRLGKVYIGRSEDPVYRAIGRTYPKTIPMPYSREIITGKGHLIVVPLGLRKALGKMTETEASSLYANMDFIYALEADHPKIRKLCKLR